jgi:hypothetical protein
VHEHRPVLGVVVLAPFERLFEPAAALERRREQVVDLELVLARLGALRHVERCLEHGDRIVEGTAAQRHPALGHHHAELGGGRRAGPVIGFAREDRARLGEACGRLLAVGQPHVRLGQVGEQVGHDRRVVIAGDLDRAFAHRHCRQVLRPSRPDPRDVAEDQRHHRMHARTARSPPAPART